MNLYLNPASAQIHNQQTEKSPEYQVPYSTLYNKGVKLVI